MPARLKTVEVTDYKSIGSCKVQLKPLTLLVGPNGSGKSNFLDAIRFLMDSLHAPLEQAVEARSGLRSILRKLPKGKRAPCFMIAVGFELESGASGHYSLTISDSEEGAAVLSQERCQIGKDFFEIQDGALGETSAATTPAFTGDRPALVSFGALPQFSPVFDLLANMAFYAPYPERIRSLSRIGSGKVLARDASNAADVLARIERTRPDVVERINGYLHSFHADFNDVSVTEANNFRWLSFRPVTNPSNWRLNSADMSDGTLRAMGILLALFQTKGMTPPCSLIGIEEPEANLHPAGAGVLLDALLEASREVSIVATTHSADLLDRKDLPEDALLAVALHDGETVIGPLEDSSKNILRKRLYTAGELLRSNQILPEGAASYK